MPTMDGSSGCDEDDHRRRLPARPPDSEVLHMCFPAVRGIDAVEPVRDRMIEAVALPYLSTPHFSSTLLMGIKASAFCGFEECWREMVAAAGDDTILDEDWAAQEALGKDILSDFTASEVFEQAKTPGRSAADYAAVAALAKAPLTCRRSPMGPEPVAARASRVRRNADIATNRRWSVRSAGRTLAGTGTRTRHHSAYPLRCGLCKGSGPVTGMGRCWLCRRFGGSRLACLAAPLAQHNAAPRLSLQP